MAKRKHSCCGRKFKNVSALNQHVGDMHPNRPVKAERPARKGIWRPFLASFFGSVAGVLVALALYQHAPALIQEASAQTTGIVKAVHVSRR